VLGPATPVTTDEAGGLEVGGDSATAAVVAALAFAHGWERSAEPGTAESAGPVRLRPASP